MEARSALPIEADIDRPINHVSFGPEADIWIERDRLSQKNFSYVLARLNVDDSER